MSHKPLNLRGHVSGDLVAVAMHPEKRGGGYYWRCVCRCGGRSDVRATNLSRRITKSCGCLIGRVLSQRMRQHGLGNTPLAAVWRAMINRCHNPKSTAYRRYGARGIWVCQRWRESFLAFVEDMGSRPDGHQLDRTNNDGNYEPGNVKWVLPQANQRNRSDNRLLTHDGHTRTITEWAEVTGIKMGTIWKRLELGWSAERTLDPRDGRL